MEQYIRIPTSDGFQIKGILNWKEKSDRLVIFVHGLTWYMFEAHYYAGKEFFVDHGFEVFRFNFYDGAEYYRDLKTSSIQTHSIDLEHIFEYFADAYKEVYVVSHSLWWPSVIGVSTLPSNIKKMIFWDPAFDNVAVRDKFSQVGDVYMFTPRDGRDIQVSLDMIEQREENHLQKLADFSFTRENMYILYAGRNTKLDFKAETDALHIPSDIIEWANHGFTQEGKYEELFQKTLAFIG